MYSIRRSQTAKLVRPLLLVGIGGVGRKKSRVTLFHSGEIPIRLRLTSNERSELYYHAGQDFRLATGIEANASLSAELTTPSTRMLDARRQVIWLYLRWAHNAIDKERQAAECAAPVLFCSNRDVRTRSITQPKTTRCPYSRRPMYLTPSWPSFPLPVQPGWKPGCSQPRCHLH